MEGAKKSNWIMHYSKLICSKILHTDQSNHKFTSSNAKTLFIYLYYYFSGDYLCVFWYRFFVGEHCHVYITFNV